MKAVREDLLLKIAVDRMKMPWAAAVTVIASGLLVALLAATLLDGPLTERLNWQYLRGPLLPVAIVVYVLAIYPLMRRLSDRVTPSIRKVSFEASGGVAPTSHRRHWEVLSALAGSGLLVSVEQTMVLGRRSPGRIRGGDGRHHVRDAWTARL